MRKIYLKKSSKLNKFRKRLHLILVVKIMNKIQNLSFIILYNIILSF